MASTRLKESRLLRGSFLNVSYWRFLYGHIFENLVSVLKIRYFLLFYVELVYIALITLATKCLDCSSVYPDPQVFDFNEILVYMLFVWLEFSRKTET